jgi:glycosyltransferase involved in cell wall biosynthesis
MEVERRTRSERPEIRARPRILFVIPSIQRRAGGPAHTLAEYLAELTASGVDTVVASTNCPAPEVEWLLQNAPRTEIELFPAFWRRAFLTSPLLALWVARHACEFDAVHVFGMLNPISSLCARLARVRNDTVVVSALGTISNYTFAHRRTLIKRAWWHLLDLPNAKRVTIHVESDAEAREAVAREPCLADRIKIVPPPFRIPEPSKAIARDHDVVLFLSRLDRIKNIELLFEAWPQVLAVRPNARLLIAGDGEKRYVASLRHFACRSSKETSSIAFLGFVDGERKLELFRSSTVFVLPSHRENFGLAAIEAAAAGLPCVLSPNVAVGDLLEASGLARCFYGGAKALADEIVKSLIDANLQRFCALNAREIVSRIGARATGRSLCRLYSTACVNAIEQQTRDSTLHHARALPFSMTSPS